ncbi:Rho GTPase-activating protein 26 [Smittium mucronatum]|uniref:Rho GTPase-activating protein 26 n=1 Tax=Smittium mucronatum TaxID=133383 RepID=A0A1R0H272_9FUNG|nr:Rho GTPase-activating protein 26 [Smittium mucronatum]
MKLLIPALDSNPSLIIKSAQFVSMPYSPPSLPHRPHPHSLSQPQPCIYSLQLVSTVPEHPTNLCSVHKFDPLIYHSQPTVLKRNSLFIGLEAKQAIASCKADNPEELDFTKGQILINVVKSDEPGWLVGTVQESGVSGMFPENYIEPVIEAPSIINSLKSDLIYKPPQSATTNSAPQRETTYSKNLKARMDKYLAANPNSPDVSQKPAAFPKKPVSEKPIPKPNPRPVSEQPISGLVPGNGKQEPVLSSLISPDTPNPKPVAGKPNPIPRPTSDKPIPKPNPRPVSDKPVHVSNSLDLPETQKPNIKPVSNKPTPLQRPTSDKPIPKPNPPSASDKPIPVQRPVSDKPYPKLIADKPSPVPRPTSDKPIPKPNPRPTPNKLDSKLNALDLSETPRPHSQIPFGKSNETSTKPPPARPNKPAELAPKLAQKEFNTNISQNPSSSNSTYDEKTLNPNLNPNPNPKPKFLAPKPSPGSNAKNALPTFDTLPNQESSTVAKNASTESPFSPDNMDVFTKRILNPSKISNSLSISSTSSSLKSSTTSLVSLSTKPVGYINNGSGNRSINPFKQPHSSSLSKNEIDQAFSVNIDTPPPSLPKRSSTKSSKDPSPAPAISRKPKPTPLPITNPTESPEISPNQSPETCFENTGTFGGIPPSAPKFPNGSLAKLGTSECQRYTHLFSKLTKKKVNSLSRAQFEPILNKTNLGKIDIERVWQLSDLDRDNRLSRCEFILAMWLIDFSIMFGFVPDTFLADDLRVALSFQ